ncbi:hypothetical protein [Chryseobacterium sp.]|uniref:hypothetical protein n=1 Tax=Chryseobacterium sp. TaxID=1871047 RepID=UPI0038901700
MKKNIFNFFFIFITIFVTAQNKFKLPKNYNLVQELEGDLDNDGVAEKIILANTDVLLDGIDNANFKRELLIYKKKNSKYEIWKTGGDFLISSRDGFYPDDNTIEIKVKKNVLTIHQKLYLNSKTTEIDHFTFRFQNNDLFLIGSRIYFQKNCDGEIVNEINFSTGKCILKEDYEVCEDDSSVKTNSIYKEFIHKFTKLISFREFISGQHSIKVPNTNKTITY